MMNNNINEKRSEARILTRLHSRLKIVSTESTDSSEGDLIECVTRDMSFTGICLMVNVDIPQSTRCMLKIENQQTGIEYNHMCEIAWSRENDDGYLIGAHIYEHLCDVAEWKNMVIQLLSG
ncbi:MAG: PilZ domain-containing protein [Gammaproteobacteria bacterium]|nr:PilZ domain-containing protein [Gammaproteobacteria bacterium]